MKFVPLALAALLAASAVTGAAGAALAQSGQAAAPANQPATSQSPDAASIGDRAARLEEQLIDLQIRVATLRSLSANAAPAATGVAPGRPYQPYAADPAAGQQIASLEGELRSAATQLRQLTGKPSAILPAATTALTPNQDDRPAAVAAAPAAPQSSGWSVSTTVSPNGTQPRQALQPVGPQTGQPPASSDRQGEILPGTVFSNSAPPANAPQAVAPQPNVTPGNTVAGWANPNPPAAAQPSTASPGGSVSVSNAEAEYQAAYGLLLQQDYGAAQAAFDEFMKRHPNEPLAGNAQYWLGETHYVRGAYKQAAIAFLKGYEKYGNGNKGADSLLKLGLSLAKLRQNDAACSSLSELGKRYKNAPESVVLRAKNEMQRLSCSR